MCRLCEARILKLPAKVQKNNEVSGMQPVVMEFFRRVGGMAMCKKRSGKGSWPLPDAVIV